MYKILIAENGVDMFNKNIQLENVLPTESSVQSQQTQETQTTQTVQDVQTEQQQQPSENAPVYIPPSQVTELPELPVVQPSEYYEYQTQTHVPMKNEAGLIAEKAFISFGTMLVCILLIFAIFFFMKKNKENQIKPDIYTYKEPEQPKKIREETSFIPRTVKRASTSKLNTPSSIHQCILSFLEVTKEN